MPENPLLPNAQLRALHSLLQRATEQKSPKPRKKSNAVEEQTVLPRSREALAAGTLVQLCPGDILVTGTDDTTPDLLLDEKGTGETQALLRCAPGASRLALAAGLAEAHRRIGSDRVVLVMIRTGLTESQWADTLAWAQQSALPLVIACADPSGAEAFRSTPMTIAVARSSPLNWVSLSKVANGLKLPVLSVDGEDAVAVYRVMQESILRARSGGGPAVLWAMLPSDAELAAKRPRSASPLLRLEHYLKTRQISF